MKRSSQAATTAAQGASPERGSNCPSAQPTAAQSASSGRGSSRIQTQFGNEMKFYVRNGCVYAANLFLSGTLLQTFLSSKGVSGAQIGMVLAALNMAQTITILLFSTVVDRVRNSVKASAIFQMFTPLFALVMLPFTLMQGVSVDVLTGAVLLAGTVHNIFYGFYCILDYRIPYEIIDMRDYGRLNSINSVVGGVLMVAVSGLTTGLLYLFDDGPVFFCMYLFAALCMAASTLVTKSMKTVDRPVSAEAGKGVGLLSTLRMRAFWFLLLPNLLRGVNNGVVGMLATVGMFELGLSAAESSAMSIAYTVMSVAGPLAFFELQKRVRLHNLLIVCSAVIPAAMAILTLGGSFGSFIAVYVVLMLVIGIVDNLMPVLVTRIIPYENIGSYTSLRMGTHMAGLSLGSMAAGAALGNVPTAALLAFSGCLQLCSGLSYWMYCRRMRNEWL